ncbi:MAG: DNA-3-methyladenine glycosylase [Solirubrobacteraceae bacterium]
MTATIEPGQAEAVAHLRASDPILRKLIDSLGADAGDPRRGRPSVHYGVLVRAIVGQQLSTRAADAIFKRLTARFGGRLPTPEEVLADDPEELRVAAGFSHAKIKYLRSLAEHVLDGSLELDKLAELPDEEVIARLVAVKGIGQWSADIFLMFHLQRPDVVASGDLGIRRAVMVAFGLPKMPSPKEVEAIAEPWRPYRTTASLFLWRSLHTTPI